MVVIICGDTLIDNAVSQINVFCNIRNKNNTKSEVQYFRIGSIVLRGFRMSRGLFVNSISVRVIMSIRLVVCCCAIFPFPRRNYL